MKKPEFVPGDVILEVKSNIYQAFTHSAKIILRKDTLEIILGVSSFIFDLEKITNITFVKGSGGLFTAKPAEIRIVGQPRSGVGLSRPVLFHHNQNDEINKFVDTFPEIQLTWEKHRAKERERALDYDSAIGMWEELGEIEEAARVRKLKARQGSVRVAQKVVHGDEITKTDIKDSVISKSSIGGGSSKMQELKELTQMKKDGLIDDDEFRQMKKEILGK